MEIAVLTALKRFIMKKFLTTLITACIVCGALGLTACGNRSAAEHNWSGDWSSDINKHWHKCLDAGCKGETGKEDHDWVLTTTYKEATCGDTGAGQYTCSVCKATLGNTVTPAKIPATGGHDYKLVSVDVDPKCGEVGYGSFICNICYDYVVLPIPATGEHDFGEVYGATEEGHYLVCSYGCGERQESEPHVKGEGITFEPVGMQDGRIEYRCTVCDYLMDYDIIPNPNVLNRFDVKFVKISNSEIVATPQIGEDGELYVNLAVSSNADGGYTLEFTGYNADGGSVSVPNVNLYHYDEYKGKKTLIEFSNSGDQSVGYLGYFSKKFYIARETGDEGVCLYIESKPVGCDPVSLIVHIIAV